MYLYSFEDGSFAELETPPTEDDLQEIDNGYLVVFRWHEGRVQDLDPENGWVNVGLFNDVE
jgi:hypothetical protein